MAWISNKRGNTVFLALVCQDCKFYSEILRPESFIHKLYSRGQFVGLSSQLLHSQGRTAPARAGGSAIDKANRTVSSAKMKSSGPWTSPSPSPGCCWEFCPKRLPTVVKGSSLWVQPPFVRVHPMFLDYSTRGASGCVVIILFQIYKTHVDQLGKLQCPFQHLGKGKELLYCLRPGWKPHCCSSEVRLAVSLLSVPRYRPEDGDSSFDWAFLVAE